MQAVNMENKRVPKNICPEHNQAISVMTGRQIEEGTMENRLLMQGTQKKMFVYNRQKLEIYI